MNFQETYNQYLHAFQEALKEINPREPDERETIFQAMDYSLLAGGKRIRPVLMLAVGELCGLTVEEVMPFALSLEMIHTYSLIHDDLPSMDNDDLRRGKPTNHKVFGEGMALLAGDGLLNGAFERLSSEVIRSKDLAYQKACAMNLIAKASGVDGMIGGQVIDVLFEGKQISLESLQKMHALKTGALLHAATFVPAILSNIHDSQKEALDMYAKRIGLAFQIKDDILDVEGNVEKLGKQVGSDQQNQKSTFVSLMGLESSKELLTRITQEAIDALQIFGEKAIFLIDLAKMLESREH